MIYTIRWDRNNEYMTGFGIDIPCWCRVRNRLNGRRGPKEIVYSIPGKFPYDPRPFPPGNWEVGEPVKKTDKYLAPWFIPTNARQELPVWKVKDGKYVEPTIATTRDEGYGLHFSSSDTTLGCIRIATERDLLILVSHIQLAKKAGDRVRLEVF